MKISITLHRNQNDLKSLLPNYQTLGCEGLELHILHRPHMDSIDLDPHPILGMVSDIY